jgi:hypothetical protein
MTVHGTVPFRVVTHLGKNQLYEKTVLENVDDIVIKTEKRIGKTGLIVVRANSSQRSEERKISRPGNSSKDGLQTKHADYFILSAPSCAESSYMKSLGTNRMSRSRFLDCHISVR